VHAVLEDRGPSGEPLDARSRREVEKHLETQFRNLEQLLAQRAFVFGDQAGLADIALYAFLSRMMRSGQREISSGFPHLKAWYSRVEA